MNKKLSAILLALVTLSLGLGFAVGTYFSSPVNRSTVSGNALGDSTSISSFAIPSSGSGAHEIGHPVQPNASIKPVPTIESLVKEYSTEDYSYQRTKDLIAYADSLGPAEVAQAVSKTGEIPSNGKTFQIREVLLERWTEIDPQAALAWSRQQSGGEFDHIMKQEMVATIFKELAAQDATGALAQAQQMPAGRRRDDAISAVAAKVAETDPNKALQMLAGIKNTNAINGVFSVWAEKDPAAATQAALSQLSNPREKSDAVESIARTLASKDPQNGVAWLAQIRTAIMKRACCESSTTRRNPESGKIWPPDPSAGHVLTSKLAV